MIVVGRRKIPRPTTSVFCAVLVLLDSIEVAQRHCDGHRVGTGENIRFVAGKNICETIIETAFKQQGVLGVDVQQIVYGEQGGVVDTPKDKCPVGSMPQAADTPHDEDVAEDFSLTAMTAA
jgi:hypothetical protein